MLDLGIAGSSAADRLDLAGVDWDSVGDAAPRSLRLTRRGLIVAVAATFLSCALLVLVARLSVAGVAAPTVRPVGTVTIQSGDTLWSIAEQAAPGRDPRLEVDHLRKLNHLQSPMLAPGQTLKLG